MERIERIAKLLAPVLGAAYFALDLPFLAWACAAAALVAMALAVARRARTEPPRFPDLRSAAVGGLLAGLLVFAAVFVASLAVGFVVALVKGASAGRVLAVAFRFSAICAVALLLLQAAESLVRRMLRSGPGR